VVLVEEDVMAVRAEAGMVEGREPHMIVEVVGVVVLGNSNLLSAAALDGSFAAAGGAHAVLPLDVPRHLESQNYSY